MVFINHIFTMGGGLQNYWRKKITKVYIPYLIITIIKLVYSLPQDYRIYVFSILGLDFGYNIDNSMWYISYIFIWYVVFYLSAKVSISFKRNLIPWILLSSGGIAYYLSLKYDFVYHPYRGVDSYGLCFPMGVVVAFLEEINFFTNHKKLSDTLFGLLALLSIGLIHNYSHNLNSESILYYQEYMMFSCAVAYIIILFFCIFKSVDNKIFRFVSKIGEISYSMYLIEAWLLEITFRKTINDTNIYFIASLAIISIIICAMILQKQVFEKMIEWVRKLWRSTNPET